MRLAGIALALALSLGAAPAVADPSVWGLVRSPDNAARRALIAEASAKQLEYHLAARPRRDHVPSREELATYAELYLAPAAELLERADAGRSRDLFVRQQLAEVYSLLFKHGQAVAVLETIVRSDPPAALKARAWSSLAIEYAHLGRTPEEIDAYSKALDAQPMPHERARLLANRAEGYMLLGDLTAAVEGYRAAIALMTLDSFMHRAGATTLWGLAVALDRSGDLDGGLEAVRVARSYDRFDAQLNAPGWVYLPDYDEHWYTALGHWSVARLTDVPAVRAEAYGRAIAALEAYTVRAARDDRWLPLARARLLQCEKERAEFLKRDAARRAAEAKAHGVKR